MLTQIKSTIVVLGECRFEVLVSGSRFLGVGRVWIGETLIRSGRLPWRVDTQSFNGFDLSDIELLEIVETVSEVRLLLRLHFRPLKVKLLRDHSFDPIHETGDWDNETPTAERCLSLVFTLATDELAGETFHGFAFHYEYESNEVPLFYLYDMASWEIDGDICGATVINQSSCSPPRVTFSPETEWTTEGVIHFADNASVANPVMTHNIPRWVGHQCFDHQYRDGCTLLGVFARVDLIRSVIRREAGCAELKVFDKYLFDQSLLHRTPEKAIMLNRGSRTPTDEANLWTWILDELHTRARNEYALREQPFIPKIRNEYWSDWDYRRKIDDALEAAVALGFEGLFSHDNLLKSAWSEGCPSPGHFSWNVCCCHEYEPIEQFGGAQGLAELVNACRKNGVRLWGWTNNDQALSSPLNASEREDGGKRFVVLEDTRQKYGGAYAGCMSVLDFNNPEVARYFIDSHNNVKAETGLDAWWFDSFYNLAFMPVNYRDGQPRTMWRALLKVISELQHAGHHFMIETFGPFGEVLAGSHADYGHADNLFACYKMTVNPGYTVIPSADIEEKYDEAESLYRFLAHMASPQLNLYQQGKRIDTLWSDAHIRALSDFTRSRALMHRRYLLPDGQAVIWGDEADQVTTIWVFKTRSIQFSERIYNVSQQTEVSSSDENQLLAYHTYRINAAPRVVLKCLQETIDES